MQVAVIGGGIIGVSSAYFLAEAGHEVVVIERHGNVAEQASFGNGGLIAPGAVTHWSCARAPRSFIASMFKAAAPLRLRPGLRTERWQWLRRWLAESTLERFCIHLERMQRVAYYSHHVLQQVQERHGFSFEQTRGFLQLYGDAQALLQAQPLLDLLNEHERPHQLIDAAAARLIEPALMPSTPLVGALYLPHDEAGNCALFTKQLKHEAQRMGVTFHFNTAVQAIQTDGMHIALDIDERRFHADAVVLAAGVDSARLLAGLGMRLPLQPVIAYAATATIRNFDAAPLAALGDTGSKVIIARLGDRMRMSAMAEPGAAHMQMPDMAFGALLQVAGEWFPDASNYNKAQFWSATRNLLPDGAPLIGATPVPHVYVNMAHGAHSWAMAAGSGKIIADLISGRTPEIDMDGLGLSRVC